MNIKRTIATINQMQADGIITGYAVGGAVGAASYVEPSHTEDINVSIQLDPTPGNLFVSVEPVFAYLEARGCLVDREGYCEINGWKVQFLPADKPLVREALDESVESDLDGVPMRVFTAEHLAALALQLGRSKDKLRLQQFRESGKLDVVKFDAILGRHGLLDRWMRFTRQMDE